MFNNSMLLSEKTLDYLYQRQTSVLNNITNSTTPGFKSTYVTFEDTLKKNINNASEKTSKDFEKIIYDTDIVTHKTETQSNKMDGNNVNLDVEMVELARTQIQYQYIARDITDEFNRLRSAIKAQ